MLNEDCLIKPSWLIEQSRKLWVLTLADYTADRSRKENRRVMERKANVQESASVRGQKEKATQHGSDQQDTAFCGKGKGKKGQKEMKGKDSFKGIPSWKGKGKGDGKNKGGKQFQQQPPQANFAQQATPSTSQAPTNKRLPRPKKAGVTIMTPTGQMTGQHGNPTMDLMEITPKVTGTVGHTMLPLRN